VLWISLPYPIYAIATHRSAASRDHHEFDAACSWIAKQKQPTGSVLTRHPGEVYWQTGRTALTPISRDIASLLDSNQVAFLLIDNERFAEAAQSPLGKFITENPTRVEKAFTSEGDRPVFVYRLKNPD
jgi:hypothetical protein